MCFRPVGGKQHKATITITIIITIMTMRKANKQANKQTNAQTNNINQAKMAVGRSLRGCAEAASSLGCAPLRAGLRGRRSMDVATVRALIQVPLRSAVGPRTVCRLRPRMSPNHMTFISFGDINDPNPFKFIMHGCHQAI